MDAIHTDTIEELLTISGFNILPPSDNIWSLGSADKSFRDLHVENIVYMTSVAGNWNPSADDTYDLGENSTPLEWKDLYLDGIAYIDELRGGDSDTIYVRALTVASIPTLYGVGAYLRIGDAGTTGMSLNSEDDLMVTGDFEVYTLLMVGSSTVKLLDLKELAFGGGNDFKTMYSTDDADARFASTICDKTADGNNVPVWAYGDETIRRVDLGLFDGVTQPLLTTIEKDGKVAGISNATSSGADTTITTATGGTFNSVAPGDRVRVTAGTNATAGWYVVDAKTDGENIVVDRNWCTGAVSGGTIVVYHSFTMLSADGLFTRVTDGAPTDSSVEIDADGWLICDVISETGLLYARMQDAWRHFTPDGGSPTFAGLTLSGVLDTTSYHEFTEMAAPGQGAANTARIYAFEGGGALTDLCAVFQDGTIDVFAQEATEPNSPIFEFPDNTQLVLTMRKPDRKTIQFVATFPDGRDFVMRELRYPVEKW